MDLADIQFCRDVLRRGGSRPHHHRDQDDRHLLVRPLPPHHLRHRADRRWKSTTPTCRTPSTATWSCVASSGPRRKAGVPHGYGHHRREVAEDRGHSHRARRVRGDQRLHREDARWTWTARSRTGCYLFKNETHNHPTEIEPFGGAATCVGGAIRDPLSGRSYVYQAMRVTGAADPTVPVAETLPGKLPQRKIVTTAAAGYSLLRQPDRPGHGPGGRAVPPRLRRQAHGDRRGGGRHARPTTCVGRRPAPGDVVVLLGGRTGRDGMRRRHRLFQGPHRRVPGKLRRRGAEGQRARGAQDPAPVPQRGDACRMIKRCNDFGAGGVSRGHRRAGRRPGHRPGRRAQEVRRASTAPSSPSPSRQERMAVALAPEDVDALHRAGPRGEPGGHAGGRGDRQSPACACTGTATPSWTCPASSSRLQRRCRSTSRVRRSPKPHRA